MRMKVNKAKKILHNGGIHVKVEQEKRRKSFFHKTGEYILK